ncbi:hypothetical protein H4582DRAFT_1320168 [Lactarius indigo]|nr:hypothetical protein H4582DRAFT_1320168 [Lactarius indigo]
MRVVASCVETIPDKSSPSLSHSTPDSQIPSSSLTVLESQCTVARSARSATLEQPEPTHTLSTTLLSLASPSPTYNHLLAPSAVTDVFEITSTLSLSLITLAPSPMSSISSNFKYLPLATKHQSEAKLASVLFISAFSVSHAPPLPPSATSNDPDLAFTPLPLFSIASMDLECPLPPVRTLTEDRPKSESASASETPARSLSSRLRPFRPYLSWRF